MNTAGCNLLPAIQIQGLAGTMEQETESLTIFLVFCTRGQRAAIQMPMTLDVGCVPLVEAR